MTLSERKIEKVLLISDMLYKTLKTSQTLILVKPATALRILK